MRIHTFFLPLKSLFFALPSICFLSFFLSFFYLEVEPDERTLLCKAIFNPFWRPFSPSFFESFVSHLSSHPHPFRFGFTTSSLSNSLYSLCLFLSWQSPLIQSRLNYAGFSSGDSTRKGGGKKQNQNKGSVFRTRWHRALKKKHVGEFLSAISEDLVPSLLRI